MPKIHIEKPTFHIHIGAQASAGIPSLGLALVQACLAGSESGAPVDAAEPAERPAIGDYWPAQGGFYAGDMRADDGMVYGLIVADCGTAQDVGRAKWGPEGESDLSQWDGLDNTRRLVNECPAAKLAAGHTADDHQDFYLPARRELQLAAANVPHLFGTDSWYWSSTPRTESYAWAVAFERGDTNPTPGATSSVFAPSADSSTDPFSHFIQSTTGANNAHHPRNQSALARTGRDLHRQPPDRRPGPPHRHPRRRRA